MDENKTLIAKPALVIALKSANMDLMEMGFVVAFNAKV